VEDAIAAMRGGGLAIAPRGFPAPTGAFPQSLMGCQPSLCEWIVQGLCVDMLQGKIQDSSSSGRAVVSEDVIAAVRGMGSLLPAGFPPPPV